MVPGVCIICPWHCATEVYVRNDEVVYVRGNENGPNREARCVKGMASSYITRDPDRLLHPMKRNARGGYDRIAWDDALSLIAEKLQDIKDKHGPEAVTFLWHLDSNVQFPFQLFTQLYGTPNCSGHAAACDQERRLAAMAVYGHPMPPRDYARSRFVMLWGADPLGSNESLFESRELLDAVQRNARLVVVDPVRSRTAEKAQLWLPIRPGTDGALALAMAHRILETNAHDQAFCEQWIYGFDRFRDHVLERGYSPQWAQGITGIARETIVELADEFASTKPAIMDGFKGLTNYSNGFSAFQTIFLLNAITGNVDGPGNLILKEMAPLAMPVAIPEQAIAVPKRPPLARAMGYPLAPDLPTQLLPQAVLKQQPYPVKALFFHIINPAMSDPNTKLFREMMAALELSVTIDIYMSETARLSDLVLPEASFYERAEVREGLWCGPQVILGQPAIRPRGESRPIYEIVGGLAEKLGYGRFFAWDSWEDWARRMTQRLPVSFEELKERGSWEGELRYHKFREEGFQTPTGQIEASSELLQMEGYEPLPVYTEEHRIKPDADFPFQLVNSKLQFHCGTHTQNNPYLLAIEAANWVEMNPEDARRIGVADGDRVELTSPLASASIAVRLSQGVRPGVVRVLHGHGFGRQLGASARGGGAHANPLFETRVNSVSGGIGYNECKVGVRKVQASS